MSYLLYVNLNILLQIVSIEVQDQVMNIVKPITNNDEWQLICQLGFLNTRKQKKEKEKLVERGEKKNRRLEEKMKELPWESFSLFLHHNSYFLYRCVQLLLLGQFYRQPSEIQMVIWPAHRSYIPNNKQHYCYELRHIFGKRMKD